MTSKYHIRSFWISSDRNPAQIRKFWAMKLRYPKADVFSSRVVSKGSDDVIWLCVYLFMGQTDSLYAMDTVTIGIPGDTDSLTTTRKKTIFPKNFDKRSGLDSDPPNFDHMWIPSTKGAGLLWLVKPVSYAQPFCTIGVNSISTTRNGSPVRFYYQM